VTENNVFKRWRERLERGLMRLVEKPIQPGQPERYKDALERSRSLSRLKVPLSRLFNALGELTLKLGFQIFSIVLLRRAENIDSKDPLPKINLSRAQLSLANRFFLRAPMSGAVCYNLVQGKKRLDLLINRSALPENKLVELTMLSSRIEDRLEMWRDIRKGELEQAKIKEILIEEDNEWRRLQAKKIPTMAELDLIEPRKVGFYYREYREEERKRREKRIHS